MRLDNHIVVAKVIQYYGLKGWLKVKLFTESESSFCALRYLDIELKDGFRRLNLEAVKKQGSQTIIKLAGINSRTDAERLGKINLLVEKTALPLLDANEYYWYQLVGLTVFIDDIELGCIDHFFETGSNDVFCVNPTFNSIDNRVRLLPYRPEVVKEINLPLSMMKVEWDIDF